MSTLFRCLVTLKWLLNGSGIFINVTTLFFFLFLNNFKDSWLRLILLIFIIFLGKGIWWQFNYQRTSFIWIKVNGWYLKKKVAHFMSTTIDPLLTFLSIFSISYSSLLPRLCYFCFLTFLGIIGCGSRLSLHYFGDNLFVELLLCFISCNRYICMDSYVYVFWKCFDCDPFCGVASQTPWLGYGPFLEMNMNMHLQNVIFFLIWNKITLFS